VLNDHYLSSFWPSFAIATTIVSRLWLSIVKMKGVVPTGL
jgi:hypothetical protein